MKIFCVGRNYIAHAEELGNTVPTEPVIFMKPETALLKEPNFYIPEFSNNVHYEVELVVKITKMGKYIQPKFAQGYFSEVALGIDFTARDLQQNLKQKGLPWEKSKAFDGSAVIGNFVPKKELNLDNLSFSLYKNQEKVQEDNTKNMIFSITDIIVHISKYFSVKKGDLIYTGTPKGVGKIKENDILTGELNGNKNFEIVVK